MLLFRSRRSSLILLDEQLLDLLLDGGDLRLDLGALVLGDGGGDHRPAGEEKKID